MRKIEQRWFIIARDFLAADHQNQQIALARLLDVTHAHGKNDPRAVACVNACEGMADPAAEIARLRADIAEARTILTDAGHTLDRLPNVDGAYRITVRKEIRDFLDERPYRMTRL